MPILNDALAALDTIKEADINYIKAREWGLTVWLVGWLVQGLLVCWPAG